MFEEGPHHQLHVDGVSLQALARECGTPLHVYSARAIRGRIGALQAALRSLDAQVCYAVKANPSLAVLALMADAGLGADIVSAGELRRALRAGIAPGRMVFSGVGKTFEELGEALDAGIWTFNLESEDELDQLQRAACERGEVARAAVRINPDVDAGTHAKISTGRAGNKFGVGVELAQGWFQRAASWPNVRLAGLHVHIGSQLQSLQPVREALECVARLWRGLRDAGHVIDSMDVGGGLGVGYRPGHDHTLRAEDQVALIRDVFYDYPGRIVLEPGRWLVAEAGLLLSRVVRVKPGGPRPFLVLDAAMNDLPRPALYGAWHGVRPVDARPRGEACYDIVGPVCESGDTLAEARVLPQCAAGDLMAIEATGAYAASMASTYNSRPLAAEVMIDGGRYAVVRRRQEFEDMVQGEQLPQRWATPA